MGKRKGCTKEHSVWIVVIQREFQGTKPTTVQVLKRQKRKGKKKVGKKNERKKKKYGVVGSQNGGTRTSTELLAKNEEGSLVYL